MSYGKTPLGDSSVEDIINAAQNRTLYHARYEIAHVPNHTVWHDCTMHPNIGMEVDLVEILYSGISVLGPFAHCSISQKAHG